MPERQFLTFDSCQKTWKNKFYTVGPQFYEIGGVTDDILQPYQSCIKMYGAEPQYNELWCDEILVITNTNQKLKLKIYPDVMNKKMSSRD